MADKSPAPAYRIEPRDIFAVEHPMTIKNIDNGLKTFGTNHPFNRIVNTTTPQNIPLYLRPDDPTATVIESQYTPTNNLLLKITVPQRTGRKRKRGSDAPFEFDRNEELNMGNTYSQSVVPARLMRDLKENSKNYDVSVVGHIGHTQRFRGLADFQHSTTNTDFLRHVQDTLLTGEVENIRKFEMNPTRGWKKDDDIMPPPMLTSLTLPVFWDWQQDQEQSVMKRNDVKKQPQPRKAIIDDEIAPSDQQHVISSNRPVNKYKENAISCDAPIPAILPSVPNQQSLQEAVAKIKKLFELRPIWTRRAMRDRLIVPGNSQLILEALTYVAYRFRAGPWRNSFIKIGFDPRIDPKHRAYQVMEFNVQDEDKKPVSIRWFERSASEGPYKGPTTTFEGFDGKSFIAGRNTWQICDIVDPLLRNLIADSPYRETCDIQAEGWFTNGSWAKIRGIMRIKLDAEALGKKVDDKEFDKTLEFGHVIDTKPGKVLNPPLPEIYPDAETIAKLREEGVRLIRTGERWKAVLKNNMYGKGKKGIRARNRESLAEPLRQGSEVVSQIRHSATPDVPSEIRSSMEQDYIAAPASSSVANLIPGHNSERTSMYIDHWRGGIVDEQSGHEVDRMGGVEGGAEYAEDQHGDVRGTNEYRGDGMHEQRAGPGEAPVQYDDEEMDVDFSNAFRPRSSEPSGLSQNQTSEVAGLGGYEYPSPS